jgi:hypothetical protein
VLSGAALFSVPCRQAPGERVDRCRNKVADGG